MPDIRLGQVGYFHTGNEEFYSLFNALEPHVVGDLVVPSLHGYGLVQIQTARIKRNQDTNMVVMPDQGSTSTAQGAGSKDGGGMSKAKKAVGAIFKAASGKVGGGKLKSKAKNLDFKYLEKDVAESWFKENVDRIVGFYGRDFDIRRDNLFLGTSPSVVLPQLC